MYFPMGEGASVLEETATVDEPWPPGMATMELVEEAGGPVFPRRLLLETRSTHHGFAKLLIFVSCTVVEFDVGFDVVHFSKLMYEGCFLQRS
jgi:hypothetical protein